MYTIIAYRAAVAALGNRRGMRRALPVMDGGTSTHSEMKQNETV
jgi:hypothetical protein